jgi:hypothetical protein
MSMFNKMALVGLVALGTATLVAGMSTSVAAEEVRDTCHGQVTVADGFGADRADAGNLVVNPGDRADGEVALNGLGWIRWYCDNETGVTEHRADCMDGGNDALVEVRLRDDGNLRIICS